MKALGVLALTAFLALPAQAAPAGPQVAGCDPGPVMIGSGKPTWRRESLSAGPLGIRRHPLRDMTPYTRREPNVLVAKAPILIEGDDAVTLAVPPRLTHRVFLYYGFHEGPTANGRPPSTAFREARRSSSSPAPTSPAPSGPAGYGSRGASRFT